MASQLLVGESTPCWQGMAGQALEQLQGGGPDVGVGFHAALHDGGDFLWAILWTPALDVAMLNHT